MVNREQYKSLQIYRPVIETTALKIFLARADAVGRDEFGSSETAWVPKTTTENGVVEGMEDIDEQELTAVGISKHHMYDSENLKLTLLDRRVPMNMYSQMQRTYQKLSKGDYPTPVDGKNRGAAARLAMPQNDWRRDMLRAGLAHDIPDADNLSVTFDAVNFAINPDYDYKGREVSIFPSGKQPEKLLLDDESIICFRALRHANKDRAYPTDKKVLEIPFIRLQRDAEDKHIINFIEQVEKLLPIKLELGNPELDF